MSPTRKSPFATVVSDGARVYLGITSREFGLAEATTVLEDLLAVAEPRFTLFVDFRLAKTPSAAVRHLWANSTQGRIQAIATISNRPLDVIAANLIARLIGQDHPVRLFAKAEDAHHWLAQFDSVPSLSGWHSLQKETSLSGLREVHRRTTFVILEDPQSDTFAVQPLAGTLPIEQRREALEWLRTAAEQRGRQINLIALPAGMRSVSLAPGTPRGDLPWLARLIVVKKSASEKLLLFLIRTIFRPNYKVAGVATVAEALQLARVQNGDPKTRLPGPDAPNQTIDSLVETLLAFARGEYATRASGESTHDEQFQLLASTVNELGEELEHTVASKEALDKKQAFYEFILNSLPVGISIKDLRDEHRVKFWNQAAAEITGMSAQRVVGSRVYDIASKQVADQIHNAERDALSKGATVTSTRKIQRGPSSFAVVETAKSLIRPKDETEPHLLLTVYRDITEKLKAEEQLESVRMNAFHTSKLLALGEMSAGIAHEINNPLTIINGKAKLIKLGLASPAPNLEALRGHVDVILETVGRIGKVVDGLRTASRQSDHDPKLPTSVRLLFEHALALCGDRLRDQKVQTSVGISPEAETVECRESEILQVLINLIGNSCDAMQGLANPQIRLESSRPSPQLVQISVTDSGSGIPVELRGRIFEPFFTSKPVGEGTGLGLSICKQFLEGHNGRIWLDDGSANTRFVLEIPTPRENREAA